jgi:RNA polymerase sigma-70 factor (ECF subfamily)
MKIAKNTCLDFIKQKKRVEPLEYEIDGESVERPIPDTDVQSNPSEAVVLQQRRQEVQNALLRLGEEHREILTLRYMNGLSYEQLQEVLGVGMGTVKSRLARAKKSLQNILKSGNIF